MRIQRIKVQNYRSIRSLEIHPSEFNILVGQNNHGKTNFFEAIDWFYNAKGSSKAQHYDQKDLNEIIVEIEYSGVQSHVEGMKNETNKTKIKSILEDRDVAILRKTSKEHKRSFVIDGAEIKNPTGFDTALNDFLPKLEYVSTKIKLEDISSYKNSSPIGKMLSGVLSAIIETNDEYKEFKEKFEKLFENEESEVRVELDNLGTRVEVYLQKQFPNGTKIKFGVDSPQFEDLLKNFSTEVDDGIVTSAEEKGDGMQRAIMLSIIQAYAEFRKEQGIEKTFLFLIDEAELHLHPSGQRALKKALMDIANEGDQILINTHSSVLVADEEEIQKTYKVEKINKETRIEEVSQFEKMGVIYSLLGGSPADLLLPRNFLIVEGKSEFIFLTTIMNRFYSEISKNIQITFAGGDINEQKKSLHGIHKVFNPLATGDNPIYKDKAIILCDKPGTNEQENKLTQFKNSYNYLISNDQLFILSETSLEEYFPTPWKKTYEESKKMSKEIINGENGKVRHSREVANNISKEQFEAEMEIVFKALMRCCEAAFNPVVPENQRNPRSIKNNENNVKLETSMRNI